MRIPVKWAPDSGDVGRHRSEATLVESGIVVLALLFLLLPALGMSIRKITACAKIEIILMRTRLQNWRRRVLSLPAKAAVPLCAAYLLEAAFLAVRVPTPQSGG